MIGCAAGAIAGTVGAYEQGLSPGKGLADALIGCAAGAISGLPNGKLAQIGLAGGAAAVGNFGTQMVANGGHPSNTNPVAVGTSALFGAANAGLGVWLEPAGEAQADIATSITGTFQSGICGNMAKIHSAWLWC
jgi:hypothetical protein